MANAKTSTGFGAAIVFSLAVAYNMSQGGEAEPSAELRPAQPTRDMTYEYKPGDGPMSAVEACTTNDEDFRIVWSSVERYIAYVDRMIEPQPGDELDFSKIPDVDPAKINCTDLPYAG